MTHKESTMSDLNNASPKRPDDAKTHAESKAEQEQRKPEDAAAVKRNESTVAPEKSESEALRGFHGG
jgi:hypothetical protein